MRYISLFAGIGGFDLALNRLDHVCVWANEWDKYAASIYERHYEKPDTRDITTVPTTDIPDHDLLVGGFPCQAFSIAGKRRGFDDTRGTLFFEIARILKDKHPKFFILENVKGLLSHDNGNTFKTIISTLTELGYDLQWQVLNSKNFGVPQNRERVFIVGHLRGERRPEVFPISQGSQGNLKYYGGVISAREQWLKDGKANSRNFSQGQRIYDTEGISQTLAGNAGGQGGKTGLYAYSSSQRKDHVEHRIKEGEANCLTTGKGCAGGMKSMSFVKENLKIRRLTPTECERLQGFPDGWTEGISDTQRYKCLGNAVTVNVVYEVAKRLTNEPK